MQRETRWKTFSVAVLAGVVAAYGQLLADTIWREDFAPSLLLHGAATLTLYSAIGTLLGALGGLVMVLGRLCVQPLARRMVLGRARLALITSSYGLLAALASYPTAVSTFSGHAVSQTIWATLGPIGFELAVAAVVAGLGFWARRVSGQPGRLRRAWGFFVLLGLASSGLTLVDRYVYVSLYPELHSFLEFAVLLLVAVGAGTLIVRLWPRRRQAWLHGLACAFCVFGAAAVANPRLRESVDADLTVAWIDPVYTGRMLRRVQELEAYLKDPSGYDGIQLARLHKLERRYGISDSSLADEWLDPPAPNTSSETRARLSAQGLKAPNVLVFYVDTLRYDVARDKAIMPNVARFAEQSLDFRRAYATGSDTLRSLPGITSGTYFVRHTHDADLCALARRSPYESSLIVAKSAREFLGRLRPSFEFEREIEIPDYPAGADVWGYGADQSTASRVVDAALDSLKNRGSDRFFMWLFNFDQHNWRELNEAYLDQISQRYAVPPEGEFNSRYRAVATAIDAQFGRLLAGLEELGLADDTVVVLVSDHGEGLGEGGFWVHSVFLWESLVHVPLLVRVPGVAPKVVHQVVSLADVAPTLAGFLVPEMDLSVYHGEDLLLHADGTPPKRRFPVMFGAARYDELVRVGMLDDSGSTKLVVRLEAAQAELHDLGSSFPDDVDVASKHPYRRTRMLRRLAKSPFFPAPWTISRCSSRKGTCLWPRVVRTCN